MYDKSREEFIQEVRDSLSFLGLPLNWQPARGELIGWYAQGFSVAHVVQFYSSRVKQYEASVNRR